VGGISAFLQKKPGNGYLKLKSKGYMDLVIELIGKNTISLCHYYESEGDLIQDPEITVKINEENQTAESLTYQDTYSFQEVYEKARGGKQIVNITLQEDLNKFLATWLNNLHDQGFTEPDKVITKS
jgi:uncharacterized protein YqiB (DUF1249 family)